MIDRERMRALRALRSGALGRPDPAELLEVFGPEALLEALASRGPGCGVCAQRTLGKKGPHWHCHECKRLCLDRRCGHPQRIPESSWCFVCLAKIRAIEEPKAFRKYPGKWAPAFPTTEEEFEANRHLFRACL